ncbi:MULTISPECIES: helix-turn-helix transcriptional regulator [Pseudonocardia]|uniref:Response regulator protein VraR n=1 Tax=Pseudonocardia autotrophica TaxID=2074 RepID=A0A1Y2N8X4_PSEAH|nr:MULTISPECIES: helix-turn-helix transcriptional regulator [Pseudonocardia]OSY43910.1 Response regulator protein VraR [Pseudonocardia autotrophica]TDN74357.1 regulatory LuxR family protein [Pseudonocardia autotrophica]
MPSVDAHPPTRGSGTAPFPDNTLPASIGRALARIRRSTGSSLAFGGRVGPGGVLLEHFDGEVVGPLRGTTLEPGQGLGGRVVARQRALAVPDYVANGMITHRYDAIIRAERLRALAAVPVVVARRPVAVLYASHRTPHQGLDRVLDVVVEEARALEQELAVTAVVRTGDEGLDDAAELRTRVQDAYSQLCALAARLDDEPLAGAVRAAAEQLVPGPDDRTGPAVRLTPRERDVLALVAAGLGDRDVATALGVGLYTVKGHVKSLLGKLHATNRRAAVVQARRYRLLP